uniref:Uncharacterized protein n=1 Tax=Solanum lycopersicum TaxID=4081 RepID=K4CKA4_SOLLC
MELEEEVKEETYFFLDCDLDCRSWRGLRKGSFLGFSEPPMLELEDVMLPKSDTEKIENDLVHKGITQPFLLCAEETKQDEDDDQDFAEVLEDVNHKLLSQAMSSKHSKGTYNGGLLSTEAGTLDRVFGQKVNSVKV